MKLLVAWMRELGRYVSREFHYTMRDLIEVHGWKQVEPWILARYAASLKEGLIETAGEIPEAVLFWETYDLANALQPALHDLGCRVAVFADDLHFLWGQENARDARLQAFASADVILASYGYAFDRFYPELAGRKNVVWTPHAASPDFALPFNEQPENLILLSGFTGHYYPMRVRMTELYQKGRLAIVRHEHPGYGEGFDYDRDERIGTGYARTIHRCRAAFTDALTFGYVVAKHFEIPATGSLLVADNTVTDPLRKLGYLENIHYVPVSAETLEEKIGYVLDRWNEIEIDEIRRRGQQLVRSFHTTRDRACLIDASCGSDIAQAESPCYTFRN